MSAPVESTSVVQSLNVAAEADVLAPARARLGQLGVDDVALCGIVSRVTSAAGGQDEFLRLHAQVWNEHPNVIASLERYALIRAALASMSSVSSLSVPARVVELLVDEYTWLCAPREKELPWLKAGSYIFSALCKLATLRRFPAGQLHWELDGLQRSCVARVRWRDLPRFARGLSALGGFRPAFVPHLAWRRRQIVFSQVEHFRSLTLMANAMAMQPDVRGCVGEAWFYSPDTVRDLPYLAGLHRTIVAGGGVIVVTGPAGKESGVFEGSPTRERMVREGRFRPTLGLVLWPRDRMISWAGLHTA